MSLAQAIEALKRKDFAEAVNLADRARDESEAFFLIKGLSYSALNDWQNAQIAFTQAVSKFPANAMFWLNKGIAEENLLLTDEAVKSLRKCLDVNPAQAEACGNLSNLYRQKSHFADAEDMARKALELGAAQADALNSLGLALQGQGKHDEAEAQFTKALQIEPDNAPTLANMANLEADRFNFEAAWPLYERAYKASDNPVIKHDEALARLLSGDYERGFYLFEYRLQMPRMQRIMPLCPKWTGENLSGKKLLITAEQGLGDVIHFCRYQELLPVDCDIVWAVPKTLVRFLSPMLRGDVLTETEALPKCDFYLPLLSMPFMTSRRMLTLEESGLRPLSFTTPTLPHSGKKRKIGIVWTGSSTHMRNHERSMPLSMFGDLLKQTDADFYAPFVGNTLDDIGDMPIQRLDHLINDFADTAALIWQMDYLITVDTAAAHLAGLLGVEAFLLLPKCPDWRWGMAGNKTPWYPSITIIRQKERGDWVGVISELRKSML